MENNDLLYYAPDTISNPRPAPAPLRQAVKAMIFGIVALTLAEIPFFGIFSAPIFAIISLCMNKDYQRKYPGQAIGFLKAGKICSIISFPLCVVSILLGLLEVFSFSAVNYYYS